MVCSTRIFHTIMAFKIYITDKSNQNMIYGETAVILVGELTKKDSRPKSKIKCL